MVEQRCNDARIERILVIAMEEDAFRYGDQTRYWRIPCSSVKFRSQQER